MLLNDTPLLKVKTEGTHFLLVRYKRNHVKEPQEMEELRLHGEHQPGTDKPGKRELQLRNCLQSWPVGVSGRVFSWLLIGAGGPSPLWVISGLGGRAWAVEET